MILPAQRLASKSGSDGHSKLLWEGNVDGGRGAFLKDFIADGAGRRWLDDIYAHCEGYPGSSAKPGAVGRYLAARDRGWNTYYVAFRGRTVKQIRQEAALREWLRDYLDNAATVSTQIQPPRELSVRQRLYLDIKQKLATEERFEFLRQAPPDPPLLVELALMDVQWRKLFRRVGMVGAVLALVALGAWSTQVKPAADLIASATRWLVYLLLVAAVPLLAFAVFLLSMPLRALKLEAQDDVMELEWTFDEEANRHEDMGFLNHVANITVIKERGAGFRRRTLKVVFWLIQLLHRVWFNQGELGGIPTIHFARWVILDDRNVVFLSNYDGSWSSYLGDFVDRAALGLTAIWGNTKGFPRPLLLVFGGAQDEQRFKSFARRAQVPSLAWYRAYPELSVPNIANNEVLRRGIGRIFADSPPDPLPRHLRDHWIPLTETQLEAWFKRIWVGP